MTDTATFPRRPMIDLDAVMTAQNLAIRDAFLEHARMGRAVYEQPNGKIVEVTPAEIFARYGFDEFGRPKS